TLAFLQYTSGSTGAPKGVMLQHRHLLANSAAIARAFGITSADSGVIWLPPYHDMGLIGGILQPIYCGSHCVLMSPLAFLQKPLRWLQTISDYQATVSGGPNFAYDLCVRKITPEERAELDLRSWRLAFSGAEPVRPQTIARFSETFAPSGFQNKSFFPCYGLAEATLLVAGKAGSGDPTICAAQKEALVQNKVILVTDGSDGQTLVSCGPSIPNQKIAVVNPETGTAVSENEIGEIWVQGECVAAGYWNQPDLTAHIFQAHLQDGDGPFLRTGDLGFLHEGELFIAGRAKDLIIIRGRNLYPQDIELTVEAAHPALRPGCGAAFSIEADGEERLVVVQEVYTNRPFEAAELAQTIRQAVAQTHEVQVYAVVLAQPRSVPKTSSGKIQRSACRQMYLDGELPVVEEDVLAVTAVSSPNNTTPPEPLLVKALQAMEPAARQALILSHLQEQVARTAGLAPEHLDPARPLTTIGLDSALSIQLVHEIETTFGVTLRMENLLQETSLNDLANHLADQLMTPRQAATVITTPPPSQTTTAPLSHVQRALWFLHQLDPNNPAYNVAHALRIRSPLDIEAFKRAFRQLIRRHPALRATFPVENGDPVQKIHPALEPDFIIVEGRAWNETQLQERLAQEIYHPFDLSNGPLTRVMIISRAPDDHLLLLSMHHIITDLWSLAIIIVELGQFYREETGQNAAKLKPLRTDYSDYLRRQNEMLNGPEGDKLRTFWLEKLSGDLPVLNLPTDRPRPATPLYRGAAQSMRLGAKLTAQLKELARTHNATPFMTLLAAFNILMRKYTGQDDVIIGSPKANRTRHAARLLGYFVNPIPLRNDLSGNPTFAVLLDQVRQNTLDAFAHGEYPFPLLVEELQPARDPNVPPIFQVMFAWQKTTRMLNNNDLASFALGEKGQGMKIGTLQLESLHLEERPSPFDLTLLMAEARDNLIATFEYSVDLFDTATIERMLGHFRVLLTAIVAHPDQPIAQYNILTPAERQQILVEWNDTQAPYPDDQCACQLFEIQAQKTPQAIALQWNGRTLTYTELNRRANQLAHFLQKQGVGPESIVAISVNRSPEMVIGLLGIQKAGGAYLPLDPAYPPERLAFMLADAQPILILTDSQVVESSLSQVVESSDSRVVILSGNQITELPDYKATRLQDYPTTKPQDYSLTPDNLAYVIYTSGSTGQPKGVLLEHRGLTNLVTAQTTIFGITARDRILQFASFSFDASVSEIFMALANGATLHLAPQEQLAAIPELHKLLRDERITTVTLPPSVLA
ncbi:MAG TPA: non-ribosomal peptide synthetase, partial [Anaerolineae bacterium]|nr:non-ribosomal peptide synthetase [Anaerolineae bacterium]